MPFVLSASSTQAQDIRLLVEMLGTFQHQLTLTAHRPTFEREAIQLGKRRYDARWKRAVSKRSLAITAPEQSATEVAMKATGKPAPPAV